MYTIKGISQAYANGKTEGKANSMFIEGQTIYSYGYHFPIAHRMPNGDYLYNCDGYSNTTSKHKSAVLSAINYSYHLAVPTEALKAFIKFKTHYRSSDLAEFRGATVRYLEGEILENEKLASRARLEVNKDSYQRRANEARENIAKINKMYFDLISEANN